MFIQKKSLIKQEYHQLIAGKGENLSFGLKISEKLRNF